MDRVRIEQYAVLAIVIQDIKEKADRVLNQVEFNQADQLGPFKINETMQSAINALSEALTDLNDERKAYIKEVDA